MLPSFEGGGSEGEIHSVRKNFFLSFCTFFRFATPNAEVKNFHLKNVNLGTFHSELFGLLWDKLSVFISSNFSSVELLDDKKCLLIKKNERNEDLRPSSTPSLRFSNSFSSSPGISMTFLFHSFNIVPWTEAPSSMSNVDR